MRHNNGMAVREMVLIMKSHQNALIVNTLR